jgi:hypothetical protein
VTTSKSRGTRFESDVVAYLQTHGFPHAERRAQAGNRDRGDLSGLPGWCWEIKATKRIDLGEFMAEAETEAIHANCAMYALVIKRRMRPVRKAYFVVPLEIGVELMRDAGWAPHGEPNGRGAG